MFTKEEYVDWRNSRVTKDIVKLLAENREGRKEDIAEGMVVGRELDIEIGRTQGIKDAVNAILNLNGELTHLLLIEEKEEHERNDATV